MPELRDISDVLHNVVGGPGFQGPLINRVVGEAGENDDRRAAVFPADLTQQFDAIVRTEPVVDQVDVMFVPQDRFAARLIVRRPVEPNGPPVDFAQQLARNDVARFVVIHQQNR